MINVLGRSTGSRWSGSRRLRRSVRLKAVEPKGHWCCAESTGGKETIITAALVPVCATFVVELMHETGAS